MTKNTVVFLIPGPIYNISSTAFQARYRKLSVFCTGYIFTTSSVAESLSVDEFLCVTYKYADGILSNLKFLFFCIRKLYVLKKKNAQVDLIVTYDPIKTGLIGCLYKYVLGAKLVVEVNGVYDSPVVWEDVTQNMVRQFKKLIVPKIIRFVLQRADGIKLLFRRQIDGFDVNCKGKVITAYFDWINTGFFTNRGEKKEILLAGFPYRIKGVDILIRAFKLVADKYPDWKLKILGWYPDTRELYAEMDGHSQIFHHPPVAASEMPEHIGTCSFLVLPSRTEAMGRVLVEAMAAGKARIGSRVDGIPTVIDDGVDGFLVEAENVEELAEKIDLLMGNDGLRKKFGAAAAVRADREFSVESYVQLTCAFYQQVIGH